MESTASVFTSDVVCLVDVSMEVVSLVGACDVVSVGIAISEVVDLTTPDVISC